MVECVDGGKIGDLTFVSHSSRDRRVVSLILERVDLGVGRSFYAPRDIGPASSFERDISDSLGRSTRLLVIWSRHAAASDHVRNEVGSFYASRPQVSRILFLCLDDTPVPPLYRDRLFVRWSASDAEWSAAVHGWLGEEVPPGPDGKAHPPELDLTAYAVGPRVKRRLLERVLVEAYIELVADYQRAVVLLEEANVLRERANPEKVPGRITVPPSDVAPAGAPISAFWWSAFHEACLQGPRMLAALLMTQPEHKLPERAREARRRLLETLLRGEEGSGGSG